MKTTLLQQYVSVGMRILIDPTPMLRKSNWWADPKSNLIHAEKNCAETEPATPRKHIQASMVEAATWNHCERCADNMANVRHYTGDMSAVVDTEQMLAKCETFYRSRNGQDKRRRLGRQYKDLREVIARMRNGFGGTDYNMTVIDQIRTQAVVLEKKMIALAQQNKSKFAMLAAAEVCGGTEFAPDTLDKNPIGRTAGAEMFAAWCQQRPQGTEAARQEAESACGEAIFKKGHKGVNDKIAETLGCRLLAEYIPKWEAEYQKLLRLGATKLVYIPCTPWDLDSDICGMVLAYPHIHRGGEEHRNMTLALLPEIVFQRLEMSFEFAGAFGVKGLPVQNGDDTSVLAAVDSLWNENDPHSVYFKIEDALRAAEAL